MKLREFDELFAVIGAISEEGEKENNPIKQDDERWTRELEGRVKEAREKRYK